MTDVTLQPDRVNLTLQDPSASLTLQQVQHTLSLPLQGSTVSLPILRQALSLAPRAAQLSFPVVRHTLNLRSPAGPGDVVRDTVAYQFSWGDANPVAIATVNGLLVACSVIIETPFDGVNTTISVGTLADPNVYHDANYNEVDVVGRYESTPSVRLVGGVVYLFINLGVGASQGKGTIYLEIGV